MDDAQVDDDDLFETNYDADGKPVRILRDKRSLRVPLMLRDGTPFTIRDADLTPLQLAVRDHARQQDPERQRRIHDGSGNPYALNRPGYRISDQFDDAEAIRAYDQMKFEQANAWRRGLQFSPTRERNDAGPPAGAYGPLQPHRLGEDCTIDGAPGTLVASADGKWLLCQRSPRADSMPVTDTEAIKQQVFDEYVERLCNAWRHPGAA
jgi:hypothetical protein